MDCLLPLLAGVCMLDPSNITLRGDISHQVGGHEDYFVEGRSYGSGKLARVSVEVFAPLSRRLTLNYGIEHSSLYNTTKDRGQERAYVGLMWRPFAR